MSLIPLLTGAVVAVTTSMPAMAAKSAQEANALQDFFIWSPDAQPGQQVYAVFRKTFMLKELPKCASLRLFADSRYILWVNGRYVERGPCRFDPITPEYDTIDLGSYLSAGRNVLAVLVHHYHDGKPRSNGDSMCSRIMRHPPGLTATLDITDSSTMSTVLTDPTWRVSTQNRFGPSAFTWTSIPDNVDARRDSGDWTVAEFDDSAWSNAMRVDGKQWGSLRPRHIPPLRETEVAPLYIVQRQNGVGVLHTFPDKPAITALLPIELVSGDCVVIDAGRFVQAYTEIDVEADAGCQLDLAYSQTFLANGNHPDSKPHAGVSRYITREGRQRFMSSDTFGCKYVVARCAAGRIRLCGLRLVNRLYPFDVVGSFASSDLLLNDIWQMCVRTIQTCSEDAYVDCASRERAEWLGDAVMCSYPISRLTMAGPGSGGERRWSDPRLFGNALRHIGQSVTPDGRVKAHHPSDRWDVHGFIEDYSCLWIQSLRTWHNNTNDLELVREMWPAVTAQLKWFLDRRTERGLVNGREFVFFSNPLAYQACEGATLNTFVARALSDASELARLLGQSKQRREYFEAAQAIQRAINTHLWDDKAGTYYGSIKDGSKTPPTVHAAGISLYFGVVPGNRRQSVERWFLTNIDRERWGPFQFAYFQEALAGIDSDAAEQKALDLICKRWEPMTRFETGTTWEGFGPGENCHDMGSAPAIYLSRHVLGVQVDGPVANRRLVIAPRLGDLKRVEGIVVTEFGPVAVCWDRTDESGRLTFDVEIPVAVKARVLLPCNTDNPQLNIDGQFVQPLRSSSGRSVPFEVGEGKHRGTLVDRPFLKTEKAIR